MFISQFDSQKKVATSVLCQFVVHMTSTLVADDCMQSAVYCIVYHSVYDIILCIHSVYTIHCVTACITLHTEDDDGRPPSGPDSHQGGQHYSCV